MALTPKRILVPTDFSPASDCALHLASELAGPFEAEIHLLHVRTMVDNPVVSPEDLDEVERILAMSDAETQKTLEKSAKGSTPRLDVTSRAEPPLRKRSSMLFPSTTAIW